jgi:hypothetical protein
MTKEEFEYNLRYSCLGFYAQKCLRELYKEILKLRDEIDSIKEVKNA